jgi:DNA-binding response OmpR family regulator
VVFNGANTMLSILKKHSILYVEDEAEIQRNIAEYLSHYFTDVYLAGDGKTALEKYKKYHPAVALLDINLPLIDGLTVAKKIRAQDQSIKIVMLTAFTDQEKLLLATELKLTKYLIKPVQPSTFKETLSLLAHELSQNPSRFLNLNDCYLWDKQQEHLLLDDKIIDLTEKEHRLLKLFIQYSGKTVSYEKITITLWEDSYEREVSIDSVKNQVSQLRKKLPDHSLTSVYGIGYLFKP